MAFYRILLHMHSGLRWLVLLSLILSVFIALIAWKKRSPYISRNHRVFSISVTLAHLQLVIGLILYFISPKVIFTVNSFSDSMLRFFLIEHFLLMLIAIILLTVGLIKTKKIPTDSRKYRNIFGFYLIAFILILVAIPWPWQNYGSGWG